jgi:signal transduction histidine kinase
MSSRFTLLIVTPIVGISVLLLLVGGAAAWYVHRLNKEVSDLLHENLVCMVASERLVLGIQEARADLTAFANTGDQSQLESVFSIRRDNQQRLDELERATSAPEARALIQRTRSRHDDLFAKLDQITQRTPNDVQQIHRLAQDLNDQVQVLAQSVLDYNRQAAAKESERNKVLADRIGLGLLVLGCCGAVAGLLTGYGIARGVSRSLVQLSMPIRDTAGKLNQVVGPITISSSAGFAELETVLRTIADETTAVVRRLEQSEREALRAEQLAAVGQLAAGMAHELRNPLTAIKILVQAAAEQSDQAGSLASDLAVLEEEITRLERLIQTFLDFARPPRLETKLFDVRELVNQTLRLISGSAAQQAVQINCETPDQPVLIEADPIQIRQVLLNLLLNALDALPKGGTVSLQISVGNQGRDELPLPAHLPTSDKRQWLCMRLVDNGPGIPAKLGQRIFEPFVSTKETGIGLGLSICKRIVEAHGGVIVAQNGPQIGAVFTVVLPLAPSTATVPLYQSSRSLLFK